MLIKLEINANRKTAKSQNAIFDMPIVPNVGDEVTIDSTEHEDYECYRVESRDFRITNKKLEIIILYLDEL